MIILMECCSIDGCPKPIKNKARKLCSKHYARFLRHGDATVTHIHRAEISEDGTQRRCTECREWLPLDAYYATRDGGKCKGCIQTIARKKWATDPEGMKRNRRRHLLKKLYGITLEQYEELLAAQNGVCKLCKAPPPDDRLLAVDHCHNSLVVRGLLCGACNMALPRVEIPGWAVAALEYVSAA